MSKVLIVDDNEDILHAVKYLLKPLASVLITENDPNRITSVMREQSFDVIFLDMNYSKDTTSGAEGFFWLKEILRLDPMAVVVLITAYGDVDTAIKAIKEGATDFILKPWQNEKLIATFNTAVKLRESREELERMKKKQSDLNQISSDSLQKLIGISEPMQKVFSTIKKVAATDANVLILGENGTGKELVARALHAHSGRKNEVFVNVDIGSLSQSLFESELFGYVKGAFTDAKEDRAGRFELAGNGTLFLDEIGNLPLEMQSKLLTVIQGRQVFRVGSAKPIAVDTRLICATNIPIHEMVAAHKFRQDLLYRINTVEIKIPPLRERKGDIPLLTEHFLSHYKRKYNKPDLSISPGTIGYLESYSWPGNVRELQHAIERSVILCESQAITLSDISLIPLPASGNSDNFDTLNLEEVEKQIIQKALLRFDGNISRASKELGLTRTSLYRRMEKHGM